jgi:O-antigen/teichoic acid export membrane protein
MIKLLYNRWMLTNSRTRIVLKNTVLSVSLKGFSILMTFILVPLSLRSVTEKEYGIILTITSIISWISFLDVGIGNGLRNKLGKALAEKDALLARKYVSTAYYYVALIFAGVLVSYTVVHPFLDWHRLLNISILDVPRLQGCMYIVISLFVVRFILQLVGVVLLADQQSYKSDAILPLSNLLTIVWIYISYLAGETGFYNLIFSICASPIIVLVLYSIVLYSGKYKNLLPSREFVDPTMKKGLLNLGFKFFLLQVIALVIFSTSNILIAHFFAMEDVTVFNIAVRYYGIGLMVFGIVLTPLWGAFSDAWYQDDTKWIVRTMRRMIVLNFVILMGALVMLAYFDPISRLWLGKSVLVAPLFALSLIIYNFQFSFNNIFSYFLNGIGKINLQLYASIAGGVINIPATIFLVRNTNLGLASICIANILSLLPSSIFAYIQVNKILNHKANGVWLS